MAAGRSLDEDPPSLPAAVDQLDPVTVRIADETEPRATLANAVRLTFGLDPLLLQARERFVEIVHGDRDVPVRVAHVVHAFVVIEGELQNALAVAHGVEVVGRLELAVADDVQVPAELETERLVEAPALLGVGDAIHRV